MKYYQEGNYKSYLVRGERYEKMVQEIVQALKGLSLINHGHATLDYGCAVGFVTKAMDDLGYYCIGYDKDPEAIEFGQKEVTSGLTNNVEDIFDRHWDWMFALDVFEHMTDDEITDTLRGVNSQYILVRIPTALNGSFVLDTARADPTHINGKSKSEWQKLFYGMDYHHFADLNLFTIYDRPGVNAAIYRKH